MLNETMSYDHNYSIISGVNTYTLELSGVYLQFNISDITVRVLHHT